MYRKKQKSPLAVVASATATSRTQQRQGQERADRAAVHRHQVALREIERWEVAREARPHTPALAQDVLRRDAVNWDAPVIKTLIDRAGPKTGSHPMATPEAPIRPVEARYRPRPLIESGESPDRVREIVNAALSAAALAGLVLFGVYLGGSK